jgi:hypothetical protein
MDKRIRSLIDAEVLAKEMRQLVEESGRLIASQAQAYLHGETETEGKTSAEWAQFAVDSPDQAVVVLPLVMESISRATTTLIARNNVRILSLLGLIKGD